MKIAIECTVCSGYGIYQGMCEAEGEAVVCIFCDGTGKEVFRFSPFVKRKRKRGVKTVCMSRGSFILTGVGADGDSIPYKDFFKGEMPQGE